ncbi:ABC transporter permease [Mycoplasma sp. Ms02]|uniref:ABC transporter permease n=1 Tax=Mycoplasma sp. Ms02 TaxID=353851 RepID=UPI001C89DF12|nr:ABC transporter permease [Mycoplasma sp. Ms02]QZE12287.1 ABC transporter permease [Mycoplasma sp. Ms02]
MEVFSIIAGNGWLIFVILLLGTISGIYSERAGIVNIAINGFMILGAVSYTIISVIGTNIINDKQPISMWHQIYTIPLAGLITGIFGLVFGFATIKLKSDQSISGFAINILALGIGAVTLLSLRLFQNEGTAVTNYSSPELAWEQSTISLKNIVSYKTVLLIIVAAVSFFSLWKTKWGLRFRAVGENPQAVDVAGINVYKIKWQATFICAVIAGIGGAIFAVSNLTEFSITKNPRGLGFLALAIMITSRWKVTYAILVSFVFAMLSSISIYGITQVKAIATFKDLFSLIPFVIVFGILLSSRKGSVGPAAAGIPYDKSKR